MVYLVKSASDIVSEAYNQIRELNPTPEEIDKFAHEYVGVYGVVTYSRSRGGSRYFLRYHDKGGKEFGGRVHIDVGYVDPEIVNRRIPDTTHLMLDQHYAPKFVAFIKNMRDLK